MIAVATANSVQTLGGLLCTTVTEETGCFAANGITAIWLKGVALGITVAAHRSHLYQRLVIAGWSHRAVTLLYLGLALLGALLAVLWTALRRAADFAVAVLPPVCAFLVWRGVVLVERRVRAGSEDPV